MFLQLLGVGVAAAITENIVFSRGLGLGFQRGGEKDLGEQMAAGVFITFFTLIASACGWVGRYFADEYLLLLSWTRPALLVAAYAVVMLPVMLIARMSSSGSTPRQLSTKLVYGFIPLGTLFIVGGSTYTLGEALLYGIGGGVGYLLATLLNYCIQKRLTHSDVPVPFKGMPVTLLSLGMISLALFGLLGHQLAA